MNTNILETFGRDPERVLDRLVDDELNADERRELLTGLDDEPGGWRRCALAFLEAQAWRGSLSVSHPLTTCPADATRGSGAHPLTTYPAPSPSADAMRESVSHPLTTCPAPSPLRGGLGRGRLNSSSTIHDEDGQTASATTDAPSARAAKIETPVNASPGRRGLALFMSIAASVIVAYLFGSLFPLVGPPEARQIAARSAPSETGEASTNEAPTNVAESEEAGSNESNSEETLTLTWPNDEGGEDAVNVPILAADNSDPSWALAENSALPAAFVHDLEQSGWIVTRQQRLWPVDLSDGRRLVVPIEEVEIQSSESIQ